MMMTNLFPLYFVKKNNNKNNNNMKISENLKTKDFILHHLIFVNF